MTDSSHPGDEIDPQKEEGSRTSGASDPTLMGFEFIPDAVKKPAADPAAPTMVKQPSSTGSGAQQAARISDAKIADIAVQSGMATESAVRIALEKVAASQESGAGRGLGDVLVGDGVLSEQQVHTIEQVVRSGGAGKLLGAYQLIQKLGEGGMGAVFKARQVALDRLVALKILPDRLANNAEFVMRFEREARSAAKLDHPNVVRAIDAGRAGGEYYFAMEFVEGQSLEDLINERKVMPEAEALGLIMQAAHGLECAFKNKLVHRDIKPDNILITKDGIAKIADLGLARETDLSDATRLTQDGAAMGTPHYISPEQARGEEVDIRTDIYALGITLYRMVTGVFPFDGKDSVSIIMARFHGDAAPANEVSDQVSDELAQVIATMMATEREYRYPDPMVLVQDLELVAAGEKPQFAGAKESSRLKAVEAARARRAGGTTTVRAVVRRKRGRERVVAAALAGTAVLALAIAGAFLLRPGSPEPAVVTPGPAQADPAIAALAAEAAAFYEECVALFDGQDFSEVVTRIEAAGAKYDATPYSGRLDTLRTRASDRLAEIERRERELAERQRRYEELVRGARANLAISDHGAATALLLQAKALFETDEVEGLLAEARRLQLIGRAESEEGAGRLSAAVQLYELALEIKADAGVEARVSELKRRLMLASLLAEGDRDVSAGRWSEAEGRFVSALGIAVDEERPPVESRLAAVRAELAYLKMLSSARRMAQAERWQESLGSAREAAALRPDADEPKQLIMDARRALGPEPELIDLLGMEFVLVPAGSFMMGSDDGYPDEAPVREVRLSAFYIGRFEVTNSQYERFSPRHRRTEYSPEDDMPVVGVSWRDASEFCRWLSGREGAVYRLPTEAEWEYAARGPEAFAFPWGNDASAARLAANLGEGASQERWADDGHLYAAPVGSFKAGLSPFGAADMAGNVWEWVADWYRADYYAAGHSADPTGPPTGRQRVMRGGSFASPAVHARAANRAAYEPDFVEGHVGFRVVRELDELFLTKSAGESQ